jgi:hypothetical protein
MAVVTVDRTLFVFLTALWLVALAALSATLVLVVNRYTDHGVTFLLLCAGVGAHVAIVATMQYLLCKGEGEGKAEGVATYIV